DLRHSNRDNSDVIMTKIREECGELRQEPDICADFAARLGPVGREGRVGDRSAGGRRAAGGGRQRAGGVPWGALWASQRSSRVARSCRRKEKKPCESARRWPAGVSGPRIWAPSLAALAQWASTWSRPREISYQRSLRSRYTSRRLPGSR